MALAGCGETAAKDAEQTKSLAAEGALLAHDASEGSTLTTFTREHARELRRAAQQIAKRRGGTRVGEDARRVASELQQLAAAPGNENRAAGVERALEELAE